VPLDGVTFFLDRNFGRQIVATALRAAGADVRKIRYRQLERTALMNADVRAFIVTASRVNGRVLAELLVRRLDETVRSIETRPAPFIALVSRKGVRVIES
jgi:hypothetical protein